MFASLTCDCDDTLYSGRNGENLHPLASAGYTCTMHEGRSKAGAGVRVARSYYTDTIMLSTWPLTALSLIKLLITSVEMCRIRSGAYLMLCNSRSKRREVDVEKMLGKFKDIVAVTGCRTKRLYTNHQMLSCKMMS